MKYAKFPEKRTFLIPDTNTYACVSRGKKCSFYGIFGMLCFLVTSVLRLSFTSIQTWLNNILTKQKFKREPKLFETAQQ